MSVSKTHRNIRFNLCEDENIIYNIEQKNLTGIIIENDDNYIYSLNSSEYQILKIKLNQYAPQFLQGFMDYFDDVIITLINTNKNDNYSENSYTNIYNSLYNNAINSNVDKFMEEHKDNTFTNELMIEFLLRLNNHNDVMSDEKIKELVQYNNKTFFKDFIFRDPSEIDYREMLKYCLPALSKFENIYSVAGLYKTINPILINEPAITLLNKYAQFKKHNNNTKTILLKDYETSISKYDNFDNIVGIGAVLGCYNFIENIEELPITIVDGFSELMDDNIAIDKNFVSEMFDDYINNKITGMETKYYARQFLETVIKNDVKSYFNLTTKDEYSYIVYVAANYLYNHSEDTDFSYLERILLLFFGTADQNQTTMFNNMSKGINLFLYKLLKHLNIEDIMNIIRNMPEYKETITAQTWFNCFENIDEYKNMPTSWWFELI